MAFWRSLNRCLRLVYFWRYRAFSRPKTEWIECLELWTRTQVLYYSCDYIKDQSGVGTPAVQWLATSDRRQWPELSSDGWSVITSVTGVSSVMCRQWCVGSDLNLCAGCEARGLAFNLSLRLKLVGLCVRDHQQVLISGESLKVITG